MEIIPIRSEFGYSRKLPGNFDKAEKHRFDDILHCQVNSASIHCFENVMVYKWFLLKGYHLLQEFCLPCQMRGTFSFRSYYKAFITKQQQIDSGIWITDLWSNNYFHWVVECLPRLLILKQNGIIAPLLIPEIFLKSGFIVASLEELGFEYIAVSTTVAFKVNKLYLVDHDTPCAFDKDYVERVKASFAALDNFDVAGGKRRIYLSRKNTSRRRIVNEDDVLNCLGKFGIETVYPDQLTFKEQRNLMHETNLLISCHGAGLTNMIFLGRDSKVLEIHPDTERYNSCFYHLASAIDVDYHYMFAQSTGEDPQKADMIVNVDKLGKVVEDCLKLS